VSSQDAGQVHSNRKTVTLAPSARLSAGFWGDKPARWHHRHACLRRRIGPWLAAPTLVAIKSLTFAEYLCYIGQIGHNWAVLTARPGQAKPLCGKARSGGKGEPS
jgi:hypothetical protein